MSDFEVGGLHRCGAPVDAERSVARAPCTLDKGHVGPCEHLCMATEQAHGRVCLLRWPHEAPCNFFEAEAPKPIAPRCCFVPRGGEHMWAPCTRELNHTGPCAHALRRVVEPVFKRELTLEELDRRNEARFAQLAQRITDSLQALGQVTIDTQRLAGEQAAELEREARAAPLAQLRERLVAGCYQIRLRAACENGARPTYVNPEVGLVSPTSPVATAQLALADAEAVLAVLNPSDETEKA